MPGDSSSEGTAQLDDDRYGHYNETPHASVSLNFEEWHEVVKQVLGYTLGPPIAWLYDGGTLMLWGENLDESLKRDIIRGCEDLESEFADDGMYHVAESAQRAVSKLSRMDIHLAGERVIT